MLVFTIKEIQMRRKESGKDIYIIKTYGRKGIWERYMTHE